MLQTRVVLCVTPDWTVAKLTRLYQNLCAIAAGSLELRWVHRADVPVALYRTALSLQSEQLEPQRGPVRNTLELPVPADGSLGRSLSELDALWVQPGAGLARIDAFELQMRLFENERQAAPGLESFELGIPVSGACVLAKPSILRLDAVFQYLEASGLDSWRLLLDEQLSDAEARAALERMVALFLSRPARFQLEPIQSYLAFVEHHRDPRAMSRFFDRRGREDDYVIDGEGRISGSKSLFVEPLDAIVESPEYQRHLLRGESWMREVCGACRFYGSCPGEAVARAAMRAGRTEKRCSVVQPTLDYVERHWKHQPALPNSDLTLVESTRLEPGARVRFATSDGGADARFQLSSGTAPPADEPRYHVAALIPKLPWRAPNPQELSLLRAEPNPAPWQLDSDIAIVRLPDQALRELRALASDSTLRNGPLPVAEPRWSEALLSLRSYLRPYFLDQREIESAVLYRSEARLPTVTRVDRGHPSREVLVGLHLDSWDGASLRSRVQLRNRVGVNLSEHPRFLLFVNLTLAQMMRRLGLADSDDVEALSLFAGHRFLRRFPEYPVVRVELRPQEFYIAPTGNLIHDGAPPDDALDVALHLLGYFGAGPLEPVSQSSNAERPPATQEPVRR